MRLTDSLALSYIEKIYQAALAPEKIVGLTDELRQLLDSPYAAFQIERKDNAEFMYGHLINYDDSAIERYCQHFISCDPWMEISLQKNLHHLGFVSSGRILEDRYFIKSEFYQDWGREFDVRHGIGCMMENAEQQLVKMNFQRHKDQQPYSLEQERFMNLLLPHLRTLVDLTPAFNHNLSDKLAFPAFDQLNRPVLMFDGDLQLCYSNACAQQMLSEQTFLRSRSGRLECANSSQQADFSTLARQLLQPFIERKLPSSSHRPIYLRSQDAKRGQTFWLSPLAKDIFAQQANALPAGFSLGHQGDYQPLLMLMGAKVMPTRQQIQQQFGLTQRQSEIVELLLHGASQQQCAAAMGLSANTIRNQLSSCFSRLGVNNQSQLMRLIFDQSQRTQETTWLQ